MDFKLENVLVSLHSLKTMGLYRRPPIEPSYEVSVHLAKRFREEDFLEIDQSETGIDCGRHVC